MGPIPFQRFLDQHRDEVHRFLVSLVGPTDADDCFQETFIAALRAYPQLRHGENLRAWVFTIAHRKAIDSFRGERRRPLPVAEPHDLAAPTDASDGRDEDIWDAVAALPPKRRAAVVLHSAHDLSYSDLATVLDCSQAAARRSVSDGLDQLRKALP